MHITRRSVLPRGAYRPRIPHLLCAFLAVCILMAIVPAPAANSDSISVVNQPVLTSPADSTAIDSLLSADPIATDLDLPEITDVPDPNQPPTHWVTPTRDSTFILETFDYPQFLNSYPDIWEGHSGRLYLKTSRAEVYYRIQKEGDNFYLSAQTDNKAVNFGREAKVTYRGRESEANLRLHQKLRWRWRVHDLPEGADETDGDKNDSAAAVRLVFGTSPWSGKSLKYIWSATLPIGTVIKSRNQYVIVLRSGTENLAEWVWEEVNAYEDYRRLFGGDPRKVDLLGLLTDSNNTKSFVKADYDDITFIIPRPTAEMIPDFMLEKP